MQGLRSIIIIYVPKGARVYRKQKKKYHEECRTRSREGESENLVMELQQAVGKQGQYRKLEVIEPPASTRSATLPVSISSVTAPPVSISYTHMLNGYPPGAGMTRRMRALTL